MKRPLRQTLFTALLMASLAQHAVNAADPAPAAPTDDAQKAAPSTPAERAPLSERSAEEASALERVLPKGEQQVLQAGDTKFLALWKPANAGQATGVVILIPGNGETADWPQAIAPLRSKLPDSGWSSLSLSLPDRQPAPPDTPLNATPAPPATDKNAPSGLSENADPPPGSEPVNGASDIPTTPTQVADPAERIFARIEAAIAFAEEQKASAIVLLGHGEGGYWAARFISERKPAKVEHLVVVAPLVPAGLTPPLDELIPPLKLATGDFYYGEGEIERNAAKRRQQASKRADNKLYTQVALTAVPGNRDAEQEQLYRRVRGWLDKVLPGKK